jgi:hypothetical protein
MSYIQVPVGWWQDSKGRMQPPGSFLDPSLRLQSERSARRAERSSTRTSRRSLVGRRKEGNAKS